MMMVYSYMRWIDHYIIRTVSLLVPYHHIVPLSHKLFTPWANGEQVLDSVQLTSWRSSHSVFLTCSTAQPMLWSWNSPLSVLVIYNSSQVFWLCIFGMREMMWLMIHHWWYQETELPQCFTAALKWSHHSASCSSTKCVSNYRSQH